jgi:hypothetical protein
MSKLKTKTKPTQLRGNAAYRARKGLVLVYISARLKDLLTGGKYGNSIVESSEVLADLLNERGN